ncbi:MAG: hypothetical protein NZ561_04865 [Phycisphaerae bacterium]|nr:hypothetical protein [Phycisphaerae bacterium]MDW8262249.1 hypothetical protein [Phycisphaerales bacterium]
MRARARGTPVPWLGIGLWLSLSPVGWSGPASIRFDGSHEPDAPLHQVDRVEEQESFSRGSAAALLASMEEERALAPQWIAMPHPASPTRIAPPTQPSLQDTSVEPLAVPLPAVNVLGLFVLAGAMSYVGAKWLGLRK